MAKKVRAIIKVQAPAGKATAAPPVGPALGQHGINIMEFIKAFNERTAPQTGYVVPAEITVFEDRSFTFVIKTPPTPVLLRAAAGITKGSVAPGREAAGTVTDAQVTEIATTKLPYLNANDIEGAKRQVIGTARSMGLTVKG